MEAARFDIVKSTKTELEMTGSLLGASPEQKYHWDASVTYLSIADSMFVAAGLWRGDKATGFGRMPFGVSDVWRFNL